MLWEVGPESAERVLPPVLPLACCVLPPCKHRWLTAAVLSPLPSHPVQVALVCGDRSGSLHCYPLAEGGGARVGGVGICKLTHTHTRTHARTHADTHMRIHSSFYAIFHSPTVVSSLYSLALSIPAHSCKQPTAPTTTLRGVHGRHGVSSLTHHMGHLFSTGREGHYRQLVLQQDGCLCELARHKVKCARKCSGRLTSR